MNEDTLKRRYAREDEASINGAIDALLQHPNGRKFLWWALTIGAIGRQPYARNALDTAFACGELNVGQQFLDRITSVSPDGYVAMMKEMADERRKRDGEIDAARSGNGNASELGDTPFERNPSE